MQNPVEIIFKEWQENINCKNINHLLVSNLMKNLNFLDLAKKLDYNDCKFIRNKQER